MGIDRRLAITALSAIIEKCGGLSATELVVLIAIRNMIRADCTPINEFVGHMEKLGLEKPEDYVKKEEKDAFTTKVLEAGVEWE